MLLGQDQGIVEPISRVLIPMLGLLNLLIWNIIYGTKGSVLSRLWDDVWSGMEKMQGECISEIG
jgi:hypothetical protein